MPNAILEAMLYGMPVISTTMGAIPEILEHGAKWLHHRNAGRGAALRIGSSGLRRTLELRHRMARTNREKAQRLYTVGNVRSRLRSIIDDCLAP